MASAGATLLLASTGGMNAGEARGRRRAAIVRAIAALTLLAPFGLAACVTTPTTQPGARAAAAAAFRSSADAGLNLYTGGDYVLAARRFADAASHAHYLGDRDLEKNAIAAECMAWLRGRRLRELSGCSQRLEALQRRGRRSDPGVNTLIAFGAIAGNRPLPPLRIPSTVQPLVRATAAENGR